MFGDSVIDESQLTPGPSIKSTSSINSNIPEVCLEQNTEQSTRTLEEYKVNARKKRRELVRNLREKIYKVTLTNRAHT